MYSLAEISACVVFWIQSDICDAINLFQIRLYSLNWSDVRLAFTSSGERLGIEGLIASCPSCALLLVLNTLGFAGRNFSPNLFKIYCAASSFATSEILKESVLIYVIRPVAPIPSMSTPSYSSWATFIVLLDWKPSFLDASCCNVDVMKGGAGVFLLVPCFTFVIIYSASARSCSIFSACSWFSIFILPLASE